jgi:hypothetical protein
MISLTAGCYSGVDVNVLIIGVFIGEDESALGRISTTTSLTAH